MVYDDVENLTSKMMNEHRIYCDSIHILDNSNEFVYIFRCSCGECWEIDQDKVTGTEWNEILNRSIGRGW